MFKNFVTKKIYWHFRVCVCFSDIIAITSYLNDVKSSFNRFIVISLFFFSPTQQYQFRRKTNTSNFKNVVCQHSVEMIDCVMREFPIKSFFSIYIIPCYCFFLFIDLYNIIFILSLGLLKLSNNYFMWIRAFQEQMKYI